MIDRLSLKATSELLNVNVDKRADPDAAGRRLTQAPNVTLLITRPAAHSETPPTQLTGLPVTLEVKEQGARVPVVSSAQIGEHTSLFISQPLPASVNATAALNEFSRVPVGGAPVPLVEATRSSVAVLDTIGGPTLVSQLGQASDAERAVSLIDATVRRTAPGDLGAAPLRFSAGVVLNETTLLTTFDVDPPATGENLIATVTNIEGQNLSAEQRTQLQARLKPPGNIVRDRLGSKDVINGSLVSVVGEPGPAGTSARVVFDDRALAILHGSVEPDTSGSRAALVTVLDGQLTGPSTVPATRTGDDVGVPPLIEVIDSNPPSATDTPGIQAVSAVVVRSTRSATSLDPALLEATAPLLALTRSSMSASGHLVDLAGTASNGKPLLTATLVPGDALVRLDASSLAVKGNLLNLASGATATVTGNLFSLNNGSTLTIDGALVKVGAGSSFTLNNGSFGSFGASGTNTLTVRNNLCDGACRTINNIPVFAPGVQDLQQAVKITGTFAPFSAPPGTPVTASGVPANAQVNIGPGAALLHVEPGGSVTIKGR